MGKPVPFAILLLCAAAAVGQEVVPSAADLEAGRRLFARCLSPEEAPVSFRYAGEERRTFAGMEVLERTEREEGAFRRGTLRVKVDETLEARIDSSFDGVWGEVELVLSFRNPGRARSRQLRDVNGLDTAFPGAAPMLGGILGDHGEHYAAYEHNLAKSDRFFHSDEGRATHHAFPYFDLAHGAGGTFIALGWAGTWEALFSAVGGRTDVRARTVRRFIANVLPGEEIAFGRIVLLPYAKRGPYAPMNLWRAWFRARNMPRANAQGAAVEPFSTAFFAYDTGLPNSDGSISERHTTWRPTLEKLVAERMVTDFRWFDAGWYSDPAGRTVERDWQWTVGSWETDREKWPGQSLRESNDACRKVGMKAYCWFSPESVTHVDDLVKNYGYRREWAVPNLKTGKDCFNNIGDPECRRWTLGRILKAMDENGFDLYREDNNSDPATAWFTLDRAETRRCGCERWGGNDVRSIHGHYRMWDEILAWCAAKGKCTFLDSCASGGGRNDIESLRRAVPFLRSDADRCHTPLRLSMTTSFCRWIPVHGASTKETEDQLKPSEGRGSSVYVARASYLPIYHISEAFVHNRNLDWDLMRRNFAEWKSVRHLLVRDFYPLTPWHFETKDNYWAAFAYDAPERGESILLAFRQAHAPEERFTAQLPFARPGAAYEVTDADTLETRVLDGGELQGGLTVALPRPKTSKLYRIRRRNAGERK